MWWVGIGWGEQLQIPFLVRGPALVFPGVHWAERKASGNMSRIDSTWLHTIRSGQSVLDSALLPDDLSETLYAHAPCRPGGGTAGGVAIPALWPLDNKGDDGGGGRGQNLNLFRPKATRQHSSICLYDNTKPMSYLPGERKDAAWYPAPTPLQRSLGKIWPGSSR